MDWTLNTCAATAPVPRAHTMRTFAAWTCAAERTRAARTRVTRGIPFKSIGKGWGEGGRVKTYKEPGVRRGLFRGILLCIFR